MRIVILSTFDTFGGAAIAAMRLNTAIGKIEGIEAAMLVEQKKSTAATVFGFATNWLTKKIGLARFALDRYQFAFYEKNGEYRFQFSQARIGVDIHLHPLVLKADVIHLHWINFGFLSIDSLQNLINLKKPIVVTMHDMWYFTGGCHYSKDCLHYKHECGNCDPFLKNPSPADLSHTGWVQKKALLKNTEITFVACSEWLANIARSSSLLQHAAVCAIPNPIDTRVFIPMNKIEAQAHFNLKSDTFYILFVAMKVSDERKGFNYFKEALTLLYAQLKDQQHKVELIILGQEDASNFDSIPFKVNGFGRLTDPASIAKAYAAAHVFVIPSIEDNLPNTVMESLSCGTPVVGFNTGGIPEMVVHQKTGYIATSKSASDLAKGIYWTLFQSEYQQLCDASRAKVLSSYAEQVVADKYIQVYKQVLK